MDDFLLPKELAARWGVTDTYLRDMRWLKQGPKYQKHGRWIAYPLKYVKDFEKKHPETVEKWQSKNPFR